MIRAILTSDPLHATVRVPGSKSITNRALVCAAFARGESRILNASDSDDTALMANGLNQLGVLVRRTEGGLIVEGKGGLFHAPKFPIPVGNAGTTLRFLLSVAALAEGTTVLEGNTLMARRPHDDLVEALRALGGSVSHREGSSRFEVTGGRLNGGDVDVRSTGSSQYLSSLLLIAPYAEAPLTINTPGGLSSASYVDLTIDVMRSFGVEAMQRGTGSYAVGSGTRYQPTEFTVETDASGASYPLAAAAIAGGEVLVPGLQTTSRQGDISFVQILRSMGCQVESSVDGVRVRGEGHLRAVDLDMNTIPDLVPTLTSVALFAEGPSRIRNVAHLRNKESDRVEGLAVELRKLGADVRTTDEGLEVHPAPLHGALLETHDDHRLAMSFALIGLRVPDVRIENPDCVRKSYPGFWNEFDAMVRPRHGGR